MVWNLWRFISSRHSKTILRPSEATAGWIYSSTIETIFFSVSERFFLLDLSPNPDLAQTICVTCLGLKISCKLTGLHTLKIKETDRIEALQNELSKFGLLVEATTDSIMFNYVTDFCSGVKIRTYDDHRMAMAFACLGVKTDIEILNSEVVSKSYPSFWSDLSKIGISSK